MAFSRKRLAVTFRLGQGTYGESGYDTVKLDGPLRASATVTVAGGRSMGRLDLVVYGMTLDTMNRLSTLGMKATMLRKNVVILEAGDEDAGLGVVYQGNIGEAWIDFSGRPDVLFRVTGFEGGLEALKPVPPTTYRGLTDVATIMSSLAAQANANFTNNGVTSKLIDPYLPGTIWEQMQRCADAAGINWIYDKTTLAIWPKGSARDDNIPVISPQTGLVGYPTFTQNGIHCRTIYSPSISFGQKIQVQSSLKPACGYWFVNRLAHVLESEMPDGQWFTLFDATPPGFTGVSR